MLTKRVEKLKNITLATTPVLKTDRSMIALEAYKKYKDENIYLQRAHILYEVLDKLPISILDDELIVGMSGDVLNAAQVFLPENSAASLLKELDTLETREQDRFVVPEKTKEDIKKLADYYNGKTTNDKITSLIEENDNKLLDAGVFFIQKDVGYGHCLADYATILKDGFKATKERINKLISENPNAKEKQNFWEASLIVCDGIINYAHRYADLAYDLANKEKDEKRKEELLNISTILNKVPENGASTFYEALQSLWLTHLVIQIETDGTGVSFGRLDQYLLPYYENSVKEGVNKDYLQELLDCFWIKTNHLFKFRPLAAAKLWSGYIMNQNITIAGTKDDGSDASNDLSYMCLNCQRRLRLKEPQFSFRVAEVTPRELIKEAAKTIATGGGKPQFVSDVTISQSLNTLGIPMDVAKNFAIVGCVEPSVVGGWGRFKSGHINLPKILELMLNEGLDPVKNIACGINTGKDFSSFEDFYNAFQREFDFVFSRLVHIQKDITHKVLEEDIPHVYLSTIFPDCIGKGQDFTGGGSLYNWTSFTVTGLANVIDSLYSIKTLVYDKKLYTLDQIKAALADNFENDTVMLKDILSLPKYGNDIEDVDALGHKVADMLYDTASNYRGHHDSPVTIGYVTVTKSVSYGKRTGATPDGRKAFEAFADGVSPTHKFDICGPTAVMNSASKLDLLRAGEGCILNQKFMASSLNEDYQREKFVDFLKTYLLDIGGLHVQFNIVDKDTLLKAQENPDEYRNLLVRVSGFSAYFTDLSKEVQNDIIGRTEFESI